MVVIKLVPYKLKIRDMRFRKKGQPHVFINLLTGLNFPGLFSDFLSANRNYVNNADSTYMGCKEFLHNKDDDVYYGSIGYGDFGYNSKIKNIKTTQITKEKTTIETEEIPYYYMMKIIGDYAIICINQFKRRGIKTMLKDQLREFLRDKGINSGGIELYVNPITSHDLSKVFKINKIRYIRNRIPRDSERGLLKALGKYEVGTLIEEKIITIRNSKTPISEFIKSIKSGLVNNDCKKYLEIDGETYKTLRLEVELKDGSSRVLIVDQGICFSEGEEIEFEGDFPKLDIFYNKAIGFLKEVAENV
ncbi:hypothetical protein J4226_02945 [Candidatus Pacearchaeota archaeon]|nr:hypothetical protein [Candidatus Pacearchaeota archaeon]